MSGNSESPSATKDDKILSNQMCETQPLYCARCGAFFGYQAIMLGIIRLKCRRCKEWTIINISPDVEE